MKYVALLLVLAGCADIQDNTTLSDKIIIGTTFAAIVYGISTIIEVSP
jgi:hypothetical protein